MKYSKIMCKMKNGKITGMNIELNMNILKIFSWI